MVESGGELVGAAANAPNRRTLLARQAACAAAGHRSSGGLLSDASHEADDQGDERRPKPAVDLRARRPAPGRLVGEAE
jgi:hypothetical protein